MKVSEDVPCRHGIDEVTYEHSHAHVFDQRKFGDSAKFSSLRAKVCDWLGDGDGYVRPTRLFRLSLVRFQTQRGLVDACVT